VTRAPLPGLVLGILAACSGVPIDAPAQQPVKPVEAHRTAWLGNRLRESSGLARSTTWPGILWSHNDSGNEPVVFATDTTGADVGRFTLLGAENRDWEDMALGPCPAGTCLYVAETGDNGEDNRTAAIYRLKEPDPSKPGLQRGVERLLFRYPDQPRDVEAMFVAPDSSVHLISKGIRSGITHYRLPASAWQGPSPAVAERLPMPAIGATARRLVTGAAISPDGTTVAVLTYRDVWRLTLAADGALVARGALQPCDMAGMLPQSEAVTWLTADGMLLLSSEEGRGARAQLFAVRCPWPD
jgi:hypothetical protein